MKYLCLFAFLISAQILNAQVDFKKYNTLHTQATVDTLVTPDEIYLRIETDEKDIDQELDQLENRMIVSLNALGIETEKYLKRDNFSSYYQSQLIFKKKIKQRRIYELQLDNSEVMIKAIVALADLDIGNIRLQRVDYSGKSALLLALKARAVHRSKLHAEGMVAPLNQKIVRALQIVDIERPLLNLQSTRSGSIYQKNKKLKEVIDLSDIQIKDIKFSQSVTVVYEMN